MTAPFDRAEPRRADQEPRGPGYGSLARKDTETGGAETTRAIMIPAIDARGVRYPVEKLEAHQRGVLHDAVSVFVFSGDRLLIQRRALEKYHCGGQWANTVCTHPHWGEAAGACARRRLREELGAEVTLVETAVITYRADVGGGLIEHERVRVFRGEADHCRLALRPNPDEVMAVRWPRLSELRAQAAAAPSDFTPWFRIYLDRWLELGMT